MVIQLAMFVDELQEIEVRLQSCFTTLPSYSISIPSIVQFSPLWSLTLVLILKISEGLQLLPWPYLSWRWLIGACVCVCFFMPDLRCQHL